MRGIPDSEDKPEAMNERLKMNLITAIDYLVDNLISIKIGLRDGTVTTSPYLGWPAMHCGSNYERQTRKIQVDMEVIDLRLRY